MVKYRLRVTGSENEHVIIPEGNTVQTGGCPVAWIDEIREGVVTITLKEKFKLTTIDSTVWVNKAE